MSKQILLDDFGLDTAAVFEGRIVTFITEKGDRFTVSFSEQAEGITVQMTRKTGWDQMAIHPRMANQIDIV